MVSARKVKARLDKNKLTELKKKNTEKQAELALSVEEARTFSDELVKSAIAGFETELQKSSPAMKQLAVNLSGMLQEFFIGFKQGVDAELNTFIKDTSKTLAKSVSSMDTAVAENVQKISDDLKEPIQDLAEEVKETRKEREKVTKEQKTEMIISDVLKRPTSPEAAKTVLGKKGNVKDWLTRVGLGSIGMEETAEKIVGQRQQKEAFIQTESKLRAKEFEGMDPKEVRKTLEEQFKVISETTEKLRGVEKEIGAYNDLGYSDEQIKQLGVGSEKQALTEKLIAADPSRMEKYKEVTVKEQLEKKESSSALEETIVEQAKLDEEAAKKQEQQTTLLSEIRDILKEQKKDAAAKTAAAPTGAGDGSPSLPDIDIDLPGRRTPPTGKAPRGSILKNVGRSVMKVARFAGPAALALGAANLVDAGLGKLGVGKDAEGNDIELDQAQDDANWDKMSTGGKIMSGAARGIEKVGSFLGLDNISRAAAAKRIKSETEYLKSKEATVQDVKTATSEVQQNRVESQSSKLSELEQKRANIAAMATPGESAAVTKGREKALAAIDREIEREKSAPTPSTTPTSLQKTSGQSWAPAPSTPPATAATNTSVGAPLAASAKDKKVQEEAAKLGITGKVTGIFEAGALTKIKETETGKVHDVALTGEDKQKVEAIRIHRGMNGENTNKLQEASIAGENGVTKPLPTAVKEATPEQSAKQTATEIGKNITVQSPAPVVIPAPAAPAQSVSAPFTSNIRNNEPSISDYLRSRYAY